MNRQKINYKIISSRRSRNIRISIKPSGEVIITKPYLIPEIIAHGFFDKHRDWVEKQLEKLSVSKKNEKQYLYKGILYDIIFKPNKFTYSFKDNQLFVSGLSLASALRSLENFHKREAITLIKKHVEYSAKIMQLKYGRITIRDQDSRWGSCSSQGNLNFSWRLIKASQQTMEYVIIHELAHLKHMNHSMAFWRLVEQYAPMYREHRRWLRRNQGLMK